MFNIAVKHVNHCSDYRLIIVLKHMSLKYIPAILYWRWKYLSLHIFVFTPYTEKDQKIYDLP